MAMDGGDRDGVPQTQVVKLIDVRVQAAHLVHLVHRQHHGLAGAQEHVGHLLVGGGQTGLDVADEDDDVGVGNGDLGLLAHEGQNLVVGAGLDTAGIHDIEAAVTPVTLGVNPVPGDARGVLHDGQPLAAQLVEEHGFAHVGPAHDGYKRLCHIRRPLPQKSDHKGRSRPGSQDIPSPPAPAPRRPGSRRPGRRPHRAEAC